MLDFPVDVIGFIEIVEWLDRLFPVYISEQKEITIFSRDYRRRWSRLTGLMRRSRRDANMMCKLLRMVGAVCGLTKTMILCYNHEMGERTEEWHLRTRNASITVVWYKRARNSSIMISINPDYIIPSAGDGLSSLSVDGPVSTSHPQENLKGCNQRLGPILLSKHVEFKNLTSL